MWCQGITLLCNCRLSADSAYNGRPAPVSHDVLEAELLQRNRYASNAFCYAGYMQRHCKSAVSATVGINDES